MFAPSVHRSKGIRQLLLLATIPVAILMWCIPALVQVSSSDPLNYVLLAQEFLQATYPQLKDKHLSITIVRDYYFDSPIAPMREFSLYVCEGPKYKILGYVGAYPGTPGPIYPKQHLAAGFKFDESGRLLFFGADGDATVDLAAEVSFREAREAHPEWTEERVLSEFKQAGAKYGPAEKGQLVKDLPVGPLEPYLGKVTVESAEFQGVNHDKLPPGFWFVKIKAQDGQGRELKYTLMIEPFTGALLNITSELSAPH